MPVPYSRVIKFTALAGNVVNVVKMPAPARGVLKRITFKQITGTPASAEFHVYSRRGACIGATDLNVKFASAVSGTDEGGKLKLAFPAVTDLKVGDEILLKDTGVANYNGVHTVTALAEPDGSEVVTSCDYASDFNDETARAQSVPWIPLRSSEMYLVYDDPIESGAMTDPDINQSYENQDNQLEADRCRTPALWLEFLTPAVVDTDWELSYTCDQTDLR